MKLSTLTLWAVSLLITAASSTLALAWTPDWGPVANPSTGYYHAGYMGNGFQTASMRSSWDVIPARNQVFAQGGIGTSNWNSGNVWANNGRVSNGNMFRADRAGPHLTSPGDTALRFPVARYQDPVFRGAFDARTGVHYEPFTGRVQNQNPYSVQPIRAHSYPEPRYTTTEWR